MTDIKNCEDTLGGLRFVRNQMGCGIDRVDFIGPGTGQLDPGEHGITTWIWNSLPEPALASLPPRGQDWEMTRYRAYETRLAGHTVGDTFGQATAFLRLAVAKAAPIAEVAVDAVS